VRSVLRGEQLGWQPCTSCKPVAARTLTGHPPPRTHKHTTPGTWQVVLAALVSSTLLNCVFPFFTYLPSSGLLGERLPQWLFYCRILADIVGRLLPRRRALMVTAPGLLVGAAVGMVAVGGAFFVYLQVGAFPGVWVESGARVAAVLGVDSRLLWGCAVGAQVPFIVPNADGPLHCWFAMPASLASPQVPSAWLCDPVALLLIAMLWAVGGYVNTLSYIMAPGLVQPRRATKASALMALTYQVRGAGRTTGVLQCGWCVMRRAWHPLNSAQPNPTEPNWPPQVAHILGLVCATCIAMFLYGDISGDL
jgi:hypothetical protein